MKDKYKNIEKKTKQKINVLGSGLLKLNFLSGLVIWLGALQEYDMQIISAD